MSAPAPADRSPVEIKRQKVVMAAPFNLILRGDDERLLNEAALDVFLAAQKREELLSRFLPDSEICILNCRAALEPIRVEPTTFELLLRCRRYWQLSEGAFDITVSPLLDLWDIGGMGRTPGPEEIGRTMEVVGMDKLLFEEPALLAAFARQGLGLDLGGVGKGTAMNDCLAILRERWPVREAYLSFGRSTVGTLGKWRVQLMSPADERQCVVEVELNDEALSMSSVGPRRYVHGAYRSDAVDHIVDPRTGQARTEIMSAVAIMADAEAADALTTALVVLGEDRAPEVARAFGARQVIFLRAPREKATARLLDVGSAAWTEAGIKRA